MTAASLQDLRTAVVRDRVMEGVARLLAAGDDLTFAKVAAEAAVPERTVYRHYPTREALLAGVYAWANSGSASTARCRPPASRPRRSCAGCSPGSTRSRR